MFFKEEFANILKEISKTYENQRDFAEKSSINRTYLSKYINCSLDNPPSPKILSKLAYASNGIATYEQLMRVCGYIGDIRGERLKGCRLKQNLSIQEAADKVGISARKLNYWENGHNYNIDFDTTCKLAKLYGVELNWLIGFNYSETLIYTIEDKTMLPLLDIGDTVQVKKKETFENEETILFELDNQKYIRKIIKNENYVEFYAINPRFPKMKFTNEELKEKNFEVLGKVIEARNKSAFK